MISRAPILLVGILCSASLCGCSREWYREQADDEAASLIDEKSYGRWDVPYRGIEMDARSRYYDAWDPVRPPMPPDDPFSHELMHHVDGKDGWAHWHDNGDLAHLENPGWREHLKDIVEVDDDGMLNLDLNSAVRLSLVHSPSYQQQVETLYLSALDVSTERFRFDTQFFGRSGVGSGGRTMWNSSEFSVAGNESSSGSSSSLSTLTSVEASRNLATAGELAVGLANSLMWQFSGGNSNFASSLLNFSFTQPLLRAGGRQIALEVLTVAERTLLSNLRAFEHYRQGYYTQIAIGESDTSRPSRRGGFFGGSGLSGFSGQGSGGFGGVGDATGFGRGGGGRGGGGDTGGGTTGFAGGGAGQVSGYTGLLQQMQQIRNTETSLRAQLQTLQLLEAHLDAGLIDIAQVDQFRQNIETERANLLQSRNGLENGLESFSTFILGLPPDTKIALDDSLIRPFQFTDAAIDELQIQLQSIVTDFGSFEGQATAEQLESIVTRLNMLKTRIGGQIDRVQVDVEATRSIRDKRIRRMAPNEVELFDRDLDRIAENFQLARERFEKASKSLEALDVNAEDADKAIIGINVELGNLLAELALVQARARLELITIDAVDLDSRAALEIARANRFDWMNNRAALVDTWRLIEFNANRLESNLDIFIEGDMGTVGDNPARFQARNSTITAGVQFDAPLNRRVERNDFRQQLIIYQQQRRQMIQFEDGIFRNLRAQLRNLEQLRVNLEIQRRAVAISIRRVDQTRENLNRPTPPPAPGAPPAQFGPTAALNLLTALSDLRSSQNNFMSVWLNYYAGRLRLMRDLGIMRIDQNGLWIEESLEEAMRASAEESPLPPAVPDAWMDVLEENGVEGNSENGPGEAAQAQQPSPPAGNATAPVVPRPEPRRVSLRLPARTAPVQSVGFQESPGDRHGEQVVTSTHTEPASATGKPRENRPRRTWRATQRK